MGLNIKIIVPKYKFEQQQSYQTRLRVVGLYVKNVCK